MKDAPITRSELPYLEVQSIEEGPRIQATGENTGCATWYIHGRISDPRIVKLDAWCTLLGLNRECLYGNWPSVPDIEGTVVFDTDRCPVGCSKGSRLTFAGQLYGWIAILVEDGPTAWTERIFHSQGAVATRFVNADGEAWRKLEKHEEGKALASDAQFVEGGWDHEHCSLCGDHIDPGDRFFRHKSENEYLCVKCYEAHVPNGDLSFLVIQNGDVDQTNGE